MLINFLKLIKFRKCRNNLHTSRRISISTKSKFKMKTRKMRRIYLYIRRCNDVATLAPWPYEGEKVSNRVSAAWEGEVVDSAASGPFHPGLEVTRTLNGVPFSIRCSGLSPAFEPVYNSALVVSVPAKGLLRAAVISHRAASESRR